jgi:predicted ATPase/DNA-binding SARP family transcriptional activator
VTGDRLRVDVLGPIRARDAEGRNVTPEGALQRRLLALLVLRRGRVVPVDTAVDVLWPRGRPRDPVAALHNHLFRLRRGLPDGVVESAGDGYRIVPARVDLDADRLADALNALDPADPAVGDTLDAVLAGWHGSAYPELDDVDEAQAEATRLGELRIRALEARAERRLAAGGGAELVADHAALAEEEPLRERPRALLMAALAKAGRHVEALRVYDDFRRLLGDELGIEPSPVLAAQHADLLLGSDAGTWTPASRVPVPLTSLVGRDSLVAELLTTFGAHRLVTLIGPGGVGKTRLLGELGLRLLAERPERPVVMCELATATAESAVDAVAAALAIEGRPGVGLAERVASAMADTEIVLLLDNCEHVLDPVAELVERVLATCPRVTVVATSRERLRVPAEQLCAVPTLPTQPTGDDGPAVQLFIERARAAVPGFEPDPAERSVVVEVVRRLDGLPLAIELAAARLLTLDVAEVAAGLDHRFRLLSSGYRTSSRHGSLSAAVSWSYGLLDEHLQRTFADLSVFAGSFTTADAAAVSGVDAGTITVALDQLVERSLVMRAPERRYVLLETLRAFGAEQLAAESRADVPAGRHAHHFVDWSEAANRRMFEPGGPDAVVEIDAALPELRTAFAWLLDHGEVEPAGRMAIALLDYGFLHVRPDVLAWAERVSDADPDDRIPQAAEVWAVSSYAAWLLGDLDEAGVRAERALRVAERVGGELPPQIATSWGSYHLFMGNLDQAAAWYRRARDAAGDDPVQRVWGGCTELLALAYAGDPTATDLAADLLAEVGGWRNCYAAYAWYCAGEAVMTVDVEQARERYLRAVEIAEATHASFIAGVAGASKASIEARCGDPLVAAADYRRLINHWRRAGVWATQWTMLRSVAGLLGRLGRPREAAVMVGAVRAARGGHRIFGQDEAALAELDAQLRAELGDEVYDAAIAEGSALDDDAAIEFALRSL